MILYTFVVYYFIACFDTLEEDFIPTLCVIYLGVDRLITMFNTVRDYEQQEFYSLFRDTVKWLRERRKKCPLKNVTRTGLEPKTFQKERV